MAYTFHDFIQEKDRPPMKQLTNCQNFESIHLDSVSVQEFPFDDFIQKNELVLSTAMACEQEKDYFVKFIQSAIQAKAAALLFAFAKKEVNIPDQAIQLANQFNLPLFEIPWEYRFSEIQSMIYKGISIQKQQFWQSLQNQLCNLFFESASLNEACQFVSKTLQCPVAVLDQLDRVIAQSEENLDWLSKKNIQEEIFIQNTVFGKLCICEEENGFVQKNFELLRKFVLFPFSLWFNQKSFEDALKEKLKNEFVCNLATNNYSSYEEMLQQGIYLHFDLSLSYTCVVLKTNLLMDKNPHKAMEIRNQIENMLLKMGQSARVKTMLGYLKDCFVIYVENKEEMTSQSYVELLNQRLKEAYPKALFYWGISEISSQDILWSELYQHASLALQYALTSKQENRIFTYQATRKTLIVSYLSESEAIQEAAQTVLCQLLDYDQSSSANLMETLVIYFKNNYNMSKTARDLHIHRQSLLYRLEKIEALTQMKLNSHEDLFVLEVFTRIYKDY